MKTALALAAAATATPLAATPDDTTQAAVFGEEVSSIPGGEAVQYFRGNGDVLYVQDRSARWYRLDLNDGCLKNTRRDFTLAFGYSDGLNRIDHFTRVLISLGAGTMHFSCRIDAIHRSPAPPQIDSKSPISSD